MKHTYLWHNEDDEKQAVKLLLAERRRVRALVKKNTAQHQKVLAIFKKSKDPRGKLLEERVLGGIEALADILAALKEGR